MNHSVSDAEGAALTHEEAIQVLRLSPDGLRRLADLDEAIIELRAARRSLLANRLESLKDAFAAARNARSTEGGASSAGMEADTQPGNGDLAEADVSPRESSAENGHATEVGGSASATMSGNGHGTEVNGSQWGRSALPGANGSPVEGASPVAALHSELRMLRTEVAELRREVASFRGTGSADPHLQQIQRRLSYVEAELESRHL